MVRKMVQFLEGRRSRKLGRPDSESMTDVGSYGATVPIILKTGLGGFEGFAAASAVFPTASLAFGAEGLSYLIPPSFPDILSADSNANKNYFIRIRKFPKTERLGDGSAIP
jgi:hypothetical protein